MGHTRLGWIPKTKKWAAVVESITQSTGSVFTQSGMPADNIKEIAKQTLEATEGGLNKAINDLGFRYSFFVLTQIVLAARSDSWPQRLSEIGIRLSGDASLQDFNIEMQSAIDEYLYTNNCATDISEMAQKAAGESINSLISHKTVTLFGNGLEELKLAVRDLSTKKGFSDLGQKFFGIFMAQFLNFYLSRITASQVNGDNFRQIGDISTFNGALRLHCEQSAHIIRDFCGEWYSKTEYLKGIDLDNTAGFVAVAFKKLQAELRQQGVEG